jgi:hypothetical protein
MVGAVGGGAVSGARATLTLADLPRGLYLLREAGSAGAVRVVRE